MNPYEWLSVAVFAGIGLVWLAIALLGTLGVLLARPLRAHEPDPDLPEVTVVIAARDEGARIGRTVDQLLAVRSPRLKIVIVDDRSSDDTASIVASRIDGTDRLRLLRVEELPEGWLGKPHALHLGSRDADTPWILFSDADTWIDESAIARALSAGAKSRRPIDHVTVIPGYEAGSMLGVAGTLSLFIHFLMRCAFTNLGLAWFPVGVGAFNLVRTEAYRAIGGHEPLRFEVVDDVKLALLLQQKGRQTGRGHALILSGPRSVRVDWKADVRTLLGLIEKNFFAMVRFNAALASAFITGGMFALLGALAGLLIGLLGAGVPEPVRLAGLFAGLAWLSTGLPTAVEARRFGWSVAGGLLSPLMAWVAPLALLRSARATLRPGGVSWRGRLYPLDELRAGQVWSIRTKSEKTRL